MATELLQPQSSSSPTFLSSSSSNMGSSMCSDDSCGSQHDGRLGTNMHAEEPVKIMISEDKVAPIHVPLISNNKDATDLDTDQSVKARTYSPTPLTPTRAADDDASSTTPTSNGKHHQLNRNKQQPSLKSLSSHESSSSASSDSNSNQQPEISTPSSNGSSNLENSPKWKNVEATPKISRVPKITKTNGFASTSPLPPPPPPPPPAMEPVTSKRRPDRRRSQSTPIGSSSQRRTIFGSFWKKEDSSVHSEDDNQSVNSTASSTRHHRRKRSNSSSFADSPGSTRADKHNISIMMFSPPVEHKSALLSHFERLEELPPSAQQSLPPLPSPLRRICPSSDGICSSGGMYPMNSERPVLHKSIYGPMTLEERQRHQQLAGMEEMPMSGEPFTSALSLSMTDSIRSQHKRFSNPQRKDQNNLLRDNIVSSSSSSGNMKGDKNVTKQSSQDSLLEMSSTASPSSASQGHRTIRFDPRVTITEYDDHVPRQWYSEAELDGLKHETIELIQRYLLQHPHLAAEYFTGTVDPVTGAVKKKTLYSLPVLNCTDDEGDVCGHSESSSQTATVPIYNYDKMSNIHVRRILIVDPNKLILDLFCKSLKQIFPHADLTAVQTGEEALYHVKQTFRHGLTQATMPRGFDLVIVEERLHAVALRGCSPQQVRTTDAILTATSHQHKKSLSTSSVAQHSSMSRLSDYHKATSCPESMHPKYGSGSKVIRKILQLEEEMFRPDRCILEDEEFNEDAPTSSFGGGGDDEEQQQQVAWRSLLIGVCIDQRHDAERLRQNGADVVWGKPPPHMGELLRNQLVAMLVSKRNPSLLDSSHRRR